MKYKVFVTHSKAPLSGYYVINTETKQIQSSWPSMIEAVTTAKTLNKFHELTKKRMKKS